MLQRCSKLSALALNTVEELGPTRLDEFDWGLAPQVRLVDRARACASGDSDV